jgi:hypothetical protein
MSRDIAADHPEAAVRRVNRGAPRAAARTRPYPRRRCFSSTRTCSSTARLEVSEFVDSCKLSATNPHVIVPCGPIIVRFLRLKSVVLAV